LFGAHEFSLFVEKVDEQSCIGKSCESGEVNCALWYSQFDEYATVSSFDWKDVPRFYQCAWLRLFGAENSNGGSAVCSTDARSNSFASLNGGVLGHENAG
jgi:hypothetical protein